MEEFYKEYKYKRTENALRVYIPQRHKSRIKELSRIGNPFLNYVKINVEDCIISVIPNLTWFKHCVSLTKVEFPILTSNHTVKAYSRDESTQKIDEIDLLLNPEGFYE